MSPASVIEAAGGVLWRTVTPGRHRRLGDTAPLGPHIEVALVHRPKYDDWSLPKGKLDPGEHPSLAGLREVEEETGATAVPGRPLGQTTYTQSGVPKRVQYWAMRDAGGDFTPNAEVDELDWLAPEDAASRLTHERDATVLREFLRDPRPTRACIVVRHASAGSRRAWKGKDSERPLDARGELQARGLSALLSYYDVARLHSADVRRCVDTLVPFSKVARLDINPEPLLSESGYGDSPDDAAARAVEIVGTAGTSTICTQRGALPDLVLELCRRLGTTTEGMTTVEKGSMVVVHLTTDGPVRVVAVEQLPAVTSVVG